MEIVAFRACGTSGSKYVALLGRKVKLSPAEEELSGEIRHCSVTIMFSDDRINWSEDNQEVIDVDEIDHVGMPPGVYCCDIHEADWFKSSDMADTYIAVMDVFYH